MSERSVRPTISGAQLQRRAESAASGLAGTVLRLNHHGDAAEGLLAEGGDLPHARTASPIASPVEELVDLIALRRDLAADFAELLLENYQVELEPIGGNAGDVIAEYTVQVIPESEMPPLSAFQRLIEEDPILEEG